MLKRLLLALTLMLLTLPFAAYAHDGGYESKVFPGMVSTESAPSVGLTFATEFAPAGYRGAQLQKAPGNPVPTTPTNGIIAILIGRKNQITDGTSNTLMTRK